MIIIGSKLALHHINLNTVGVCFLESLAVIFDWTFQFFWKSTQTCRSPFIQLSILFLLLVEKARLAWIWAYFLDSDNIVLGV